jgi:hypothetical protein
MKRISAMLFISLVVATFGCSKKFADMPAKEVVTFPSPDWKADDTGKYPATMTVVLALPATLATGAMENDKLAAFINDECRGVGVVVKVDKQNLFFVLVQGLADETSKITIRYYSNKTAYMYKSEPVITFSADATYGTAEDPQTIILTQLKK